MMNFSTLPDDVYVLVIQQCLALVNAREIRKAFKDNLRLLQVCSRWRQLALPSVYNVAFIASEDTSNLELVKSANCTYAVRNMHISMKYSTDSSNVLAQMVGLVKCCNQVQFLHINLYRGTPAEQLLPSELPKIDLYSIFPKVTSLNFGGDTFCPAADVLCSHIAQQYAHQLQYLNSKHPISSNRKFEVLKHADINAIGASSYKVPPMAAECLEKLSLYNIPSDFSWDSFDGCVFSNLRELHIYHTFAQGRSQKRLARRLLFPKLRFLELDGISNEYPVLQQAVFPEEISKVFISGFGDTYGNIRNVKLPRTKRLAISSSLDEDSFPQTASYMNQLAENAAKAEEVYFRIYNNVPVAAGDLTCTAITVLYLKTQISIETMLSLIGTLHNLVDMELCRLIGGDTTVQYVDLPEAGAQPMEPFNSKLECLVIDLEDQPEASSNIIDVVVFVLLKLPVLKKLLCEQLAKSFLNKLDLYVEAYPKLKTVTYGVSQDAISDVVPRVRSITCCFQFIKLWFGEWEW